MQMQTMRSLINLVESVTFDPKISYIRGEEEYNDGSVHAEVATGDGCIAIYSFTSTVKGQGNGRRAVRWMKETFGKVVVIDPGVPDESPDSFLFWKKLADHGLIDRIEDANNDVIFRDGEWMIPDDAHDFILYHGTSEDPDTIHQHGLIGARHEAVFLTDNPDLALEYASSDQERTGTNFVVLVSVNVKDLDQGKLWPDVDHTDADDWQESLSETDQCMYRGDIPPQLLKIEDLTDQ